MTDPSKASAQQLEAAFEKYSDAIFRYLYVQIRDREVAKDLAQESFIRFWQYLERGEAVEHEQALLYRIAGNLLIDHTRKKKPVSLDALVEDGIEPGHDPIHETKSRMELEQVLGVIDKLPAKHREVLIMRYVEGLDPAEIAQVTGETSNVVSVRIHRSVKELESLIQQQA